MKLLLEHVSTGIDLEQSRRARDPGPGEHLEHRPGEEQLGLHALAARADHRVDHNPYQPPTVAQAKKGLPTVRELYDAQGLQAKSSDFGFDQWLLQGGELHAPLYAGYESQVIGKTVAYANDPPR